METEKAPLERVNTWIKNSVTLKLITVTILMLLLLIPTSMVESIIRERESLNNMATMDVSSKWAERQEINGPVLSIPLIYEYENEEKTYTATKYWHILPNKLDINSTIEPKTLKRGIYEVVVYDSELAISGNFNMMELEDQSFLKEIRFDQAFLTIGISDLRGIQNNILVKWNDQNLKVEPGSKIKDLIVSGITVQVPNVEADAQKLSFDLKLELQGSQNMSFVPIGSTTNVSITSPWNAPSFDGNFLPDTREITDEGFKANWKVLELNRNYPQSWVGSKNEIHLRDSSFGVSLILPLDDYQKSMRSAKYAVMTIALTFLVFFLVEILNKRKIHPFQYALVGLGLCLFYTLLVSISEHSNFNFAYGISALSVVTMISLYSLSVFKKKKLTVLLVGTLTSIYGFLFVTIQMADYALLLGSLGLTLILALTMYFTRKVNWYNLNIQPQ